MIGGRRLPMPTTTTTTTTDKTIVSGQYLSIKHVDLIKFRDFIRRQSRARSRADLVKLAFPRLKK
jgi:hypothetical protein